MLTESLLTIEEIARYLRMSPSKLYQMAQRGEIPSIKVARQVRILESDLAAWIESQRQGQTAPMGGLRK